MTVAQWLSGSRIGKTIRRFRRASAIIRDMRDRELRGLAPAVASIGSREEE